MYGIKVFLAGSTKRAAQIARNNIRILLSRLQTEKVNEGIALYVHDCKDFRSYQSAYNDFIQNETDIFIALVDAKYDSKEFAETEEGKGTYSEFKLACESFIEKGKPEVILLYRTDKDRKKPSKKWRTELDRIGKYALSDTSYADLNVQLKTELNETIYKFTPDPHDQTTSRSKSKYKVGDVYENDGIKGIVFSVNENGKSGKILSIRSSLICSWKDFQKKKTPFAEPWRAPEVQELEEIFINTENYKIISTALKNLKDGANLEHSQYRDSFLSSTSFKAFRQKSIRWSHTKKCFSIGDCETSYVGIIRPVAEVNF